MRCDLCLFGTAPNALRSFYNAVLALVLLFRNAPSAAAATAAMATPIPAPDPAPPTPETLITAETPGLTRRAVSRRGLGQQPQSRP